VAGAAVVIVDRLAQEGEAAARSIAVGGSQAVALAADLALTREIPRAVGEAIAAYGRVDILINNAGILNRTETEVLTEEQWDHLMSINLKAVFFVTQAVLPLLVRQGSGAIVSISSLAARVGGSPLGSITPRARRGSSA
jgi:NAD(P)-dependent dehydrogenase (short-subunit alcohol dehydrogenase family)